MTPYHSPHGTVFLSVPPHGIINPLIRWLVEGVGHQSRVTCPSCPEGGLGLGSWRPLPACVLLTAHPSSLQGYLEQAALGRARPGQSPLGGQGLGGGGWDLAAAPPYARPGWGELLQPHTWIGEDQGRPLSGQLPCAFWKGQQMPQAQRRREDNGEGAAAEPAAAEGSGHGPVIGQPVPR